MKADYLSFQRAMKASLLGLAIQLALGLLLLLMGLFTRDVAAKTAAAYVLVGVPVWLVLAILFDQHRRERIESIEAEAFAASDAASSSVFEQGAEDLRVAARRLKTLHKFLVPGTSLAVAAVLIGVGIWRFNQAREHLADYTPPVAHRGWAVAIGLGLAFVAFLFARFVSGMAKFKAWSNLKAGAGFAVGTALFGLAIAVGHLIDVVGPDVVLRYLPIAFAAVLVALGVEIALNFVLDIYRPRKAGELPRPAFESRILGFVAAPDRIAESIGEAINYQFGYDVSSSWFYRLLSRTVFRVLLPVALLVMWLMSTMVVIRPHERGMVLRTGAFNRVIEPGLNFKRPWPFETVEMPEYVRRNAQGRVEFRSTTVTGIRTLNIGSIPPDPSKPILWTNEHTAKETYFLVQPGSGPAGGGSRDLSALAIEVPIHYAIEDLEAYDTLGPPEMRDNLLRAVAQRALMRFAAAASVGDLLGGKRTDLQPRLREEIEAAFKQLNPDAETGKPRGAGVKILFVGIGGVHPPQETAKAFEQVVEAEQKYIGKVKNAEAEAIKQLTSTVGSVGLAQEIVREMDILDRMRDQIDGQPNPAHSEQRLKVAGLIRKAGGRAAAMIVQASAERWERHMNEKARLAVYQGQLGTYKASPAVYRAALYLDAIREVMKDARVYVLEDAKKLHLRLNAEDKDSVADIFRNTESQY